MSKRLVAGVLTDEPRGEIADRAIEKIRSEEIQAAQMVSRRFPYQDAKEAFDFLWEHPDEALAVQLLWQ